MNKKVKIYGKKYLVLEFNSKMGRTYEPEGFFERLKGKPYEEQVKYYNYNYSYERSRVYAGGDETGTGPYQYGGNISKLNYIDAIIVNDKDVIVGFRIRGSITLAGYADSYEVEENNGAGYKTYSESESLTCIVVK